MAPIAHADLATVAAEGWAEAVFLRIEGALSCLPFDACGELRAWMGTVAADTALDLVADAERIAAEVGLVHDQRRRLIADRAAAYTARLNDLVALCGPRGTA